MREIPAAGRDSPPTRHTQTTTPFGHTIHHLHHRRRARARRAPPLSSPGFPPGEDTTTLVMDHYSRKHMFTNCRLRSVRKRHQHSPRFMGTRVPLRGRRGGASPVNKEGARSSPSPSPSSSRRSSTPRATSSSTNHPTAGIFNMVSIGTTAPRRHRAAQSNRDLTHAA